MASICSADSVLPLDETSPLNNPSRWPLWVRVLCPRSWNTHSENFTAFLYRIQGALMHEAPQQLISRQTRPKLQPAHTLNSIDSRSMSPSPHRSASPESPPIGSPGDSAMESFQSGGSHNLFLHSGYCPIVWAAITGGHWPQRGASTSCESRVLLSETEHAQQFKTCSSHLSVDNLMIWRAKRLILIWIEQQKLNSKLSFTVLSVKRMSMSTKVYALPAIPPDIALS